MTPTQLVLDLPFRSAMGRDDFFVSEANAVAVAGLDRYRTWPGHKMVLIGPAGAGKTHLAHVFAALTGAEIRPAATLGPDDITGLGHGPALVVEDVDRIGDNPEAEETLFHLHNACAEARLPLLFTGREAPAQWPLGLPDLASRIQQAGLLRLTAPDDTLLMAVMMKLAADRKLPLSPSILRHVLPRMERSFAAAQAFVAALDAEALAAQEPPRLKHAKAVLLRQQG